MNVLMMQASEHFVPSEKACGAAIKAGGEHIRQRTTDDQIKCMIAGYKDVYEGRIDELALINKQYSLETLGIKVLSKDNHLILYTPAGEMNARLLLHSLGRAHVGSFYVEGILLGYSQEDIKAFYDDYNKRSGSNFDFEKNKKEAAEFIARETPIIEEEMRREKQRELGQQPQKPSQETIKKSLNDLNDALNNLYQQLLPTI
jgi:hypothetical protein